MLPGKWNYSAEKKRFYYISWPSYDLVYFGFQIPRNVYHDKGASLFPASRADSMQALEEYISKAEELITILSVELLQIERANAEMMVGKRTAWYKLSRFQSPQEYMSEVRMAAFFSEYDYYQGMGSDVKELYEAVKALEAYVSRCKNLLRSIVLSRGPEVFLTQDKLHMLESPFISKKE